MRVMTPIGIAAALALLSASAQAAGTPKPTLAQLVGQHLLVRMQGSTPSASFLRRIRSGEVGGVVLFQNNATPAQLPALVATLQGAARAGGQLPLLIATDQEGGEVRRLPGPPTLAPSAMTTPALAQAQGLATGRYLRSVGINTDLAPVLDVPTTRADFIYPRAFATSPGGVASRGGAFAHGLLAAGVVATAKHFPGLGRLTASTDDSPQTVTASRRALKRDLLPFEHAIASGIPAIMVGTARYPALGGDAPAACSPSIVTTLLRGALGFRGVTLSDDLDSAAVWTQIPPPQAAVRAVAAGIDMVYIAGVNGSGGDAIGEEAYSALLRAAKDGTLTGVLLRSSYARIAALKRTFAG